MIINKINFPLYGIIVALSVLIGIIYIFYNLKKEKIDDKYILIYFIVYVFFAFLFGKLFTVVASGFKLNLFKAGLSSYGGLIGVVFSSFIFEKIIPSKKAVIKYTILSLPLIYGLTKIACFVTGCCYGIPYDGLGYVIYKNGLNIKLFPIQIIETITFLIIFIVCNNFKNKKNILYITMIIVSMMKFILDYLRYEHLFEHFSFNQRFSIFLILITIFIYLINKYKIFLTSTT